jgi:YVTN family beta-propeller protein
MPAVLISLAAGLGSVVPAPQAAADAASMAALSASSAGPAGPVTAYVANSGSGTVTPIATATSTAGPPIPVGSYPDAIAVHGRPGHGEQLGEVGDGVVAGAVHAPELGLPPGRELGLPPLSSFGHSVLSA